jgi:hypothetical protein
MSPAERLRREAHRLHRREPGALEALLTIAAELERHAPCAECDAPGGLHRLGCAVDGQGASPTPRPGDELERGLIERQRVAAHQPPRPCLDPDKMHGAADGFPGEDAY